MAEDGRAASDASSVDDDTRSLLTADDLASSAPPSSSLPSSQARRHRPQDPPTSSPETRRSIGEDEDEVEEELAYTAAHVTSILKPVSLTMILVVWIIKMTEEVLRNETIQSPYLVFREDDTDADGTRFFKAVVNAVVVVMIILVFTVVFFLLYKYRCMKILYAWLGLSVAMLLGFSGGALSYSLIISLSKARGGWFPAIDVYSFMFLQTNFAAMGVLVVFWKSPLIVKQVYLVIASCIMAWVLSRYFPDWTTWALLFGLSVYDIFAVLSPCGPLKALVELSQDRGDAIPGLVYEAAPPEKRAGRPRQARELLSSSDQQPSSSSSSSSLQQAQGSGRASRTSNPSPLRHRNGSGLESGQRQEEEAGASNGGLMPSSAQGESAAASGGSRRDFSRERDSLHRMEGGRAGSHASSVSQASSEEDRGVKLGLGDFVFYSVLIGRAAIFDFTTVVTCFLAILTVKGEPNGLVLLTISAGSHPHSLLSRRLPQGSSGPPFQHLPRDCNLPHHQSRHNPVPPTASDAASLSLSELLGDSAAGQ
eukprot:759818-Hanusia_phi.AAC.2